jgi:hypothetical protein
LNVKLRDVAADVIAEATGSAERNSPRHLTSTATGFAGRAPAG